jgi:hypothetical protein
LSFAVLAVLGANRSRHRLPIAYKSPLFFCGLIPQAHWMPNVLEAWIGPQVLDEWVTMLADNAVGSLLVGFHDPLQRLLFFIQFSLWF